MQALQGYEEALSFEKNTQIPRRVQRCPITYAQMGSFISIYSGYDRIEMAARFAMVDCDAP
jgi:hypothetical protein